MSTTSITDLVDLCARERARCDALFERLGEWVASTTDPRLQRLFATAAHRHAWHASLWTDRAPTIPILPAEGDAPTIAAADSDTDRWAAYAAALGVLRADLVVMRAAVDDDLDPSTARVIDLVASDARDLAARITSVTPS